MKHELTYSMFSEVGDKHHKETFFFESTEKGLYSILGFNWDSTSTYMHENGYHFLKVEEDGIDDLVLYTSRDDLIPEYNSNYFRKLVIDNDIDKLKASLLLPTKSEQTLYLGEIKFKNGEHYSVDIVDPLTYRITLEGSIISYGENKQDVEDVEYFYSYFTSRSIIFKSYNKLSS